MAHLEDLDDKQRERLADAGMQAVRGIAAVFGDPDGGVCSGCLISAMAWLLVCTVADDDIPAHVAGRAIAIAVARAADRLRGERLEGCHGDQEHGVEMAAAPLRQPQRVGHA